jgi:metal-responsive CopG/Arc/MetJ family transcriptional regulator
VYLPKHTVDGLDREATQRGFDSRSALLREVLDRHLKDTGRN